MLARRNDGRLQVMLMLVCMSAAWGSGKTGKADTSTDAETAFASIPWKEGPCNGDLGGYAEIRVPEGFLFTGPDGAPKYLELSENPPNPTTVGVLFPTSDDDQWVVYFNYRDIGHVPDDDHKTIDAAAILASLKAGTEASNSERRIRGWNELHVTDWIIPPGYETDTRRLAWGVGLKTDGGSDEANYDVRLLGRTGVMSVTLVCSPDSVRNLVPKLQTILAGFNYNSGHKYGEWRSGDKMAAYGLTGLITGGAAVAAAKSGLLAKIGIAIAKMGKAIFIGILAICAGIWQMIFGKKSSASKK